VALKTGEGVASMIGSFIKQEFRRSWLTMAMGLLARPVLVAIKSRLDAGQYNGGALLGLRGLVFKSHGSADARSFAYALERAYDASRYDLLDRVKVRVARATPLLAVSGVKAEG
jgi:glycerol-3-phosphate acyltransferase PlsX